ncbi:methenyltetrahydrofolate synthase domain-containing protein isoform X5 [Hemicordylus capensis]|uniref:methenyltetrahydrofolate synthase domain-containing protein isoform X5 n=1 Tax=Hemicordylus capensis TaxID=884348 RepID=UPI002303CBFD|nr:methenyltetrahydrofolate synthase domain-containing protein isoform X5 [Hemicordylus capensis]
MQAAEPPGSNAGVSKWDIRKQIWDYMETNNLADFPRPVHHRIPNFKGSLLMSHAVQKCDVFDKAREVKVDPDKPLEGIRLAVLQARKTLLVPTPRLRTGLFNKIVPPSGAAKDILRKCATSQVVDIPEELLGSHDLTVDYILTPTRVIETGCKRPKPQGILWYKISHETLGKIPILKNLRYQEKQAGRDVTLKDEWPDVAAAGKAERTASKMRPESPWLQNETSLAQARSGEEPLFDPLHQPASPTTVYVGNIPPGTRVRELKDALRERHATPMRLTWQGAQHLAFLSYDDASTADEAIEALQGLSIRGCSLRIELAKNQRSKMSNRPRQAARSKGQANEDFGHGQ